MIDNKIIDELKNRGSITNTTEDYTVYEDLGELKLHGLVNDIAINNVYDDILEHINDDKQTDEPQDDIVVDDDTE
jgi:hypothetical protein